MAAIDPAIDLTDPSFVAGALLGEKFVLRRPLAAGGSGEVWVATNRATRGVVALKLVRRPSGLVAARFKQEAELSAALTHRNIVRVYDYFADGAGHLGLVMELLRGETARERLDRTGPLSPRAALAVVTQTLTGLAHAHERRIVHRDIKPPNLYLATDPDGSTTTKILDFGIARTPANSVQTLHGQLLGTPRYMSPEQIRAEPGLDGRSDLFSLAVVLYELLTGRSPFAAPFATASLALVLEKAVERDDRIPEPLWKVLEQALAKDPTARPPTAKAMADLLRGALAVEDGELARELHRSRPPPPLVTDDPDTPVALATPSGHGTRKATPSTPTAAFRSNLFVAAVAACGALVALAAARVLTHPPEKPPPTAVAPPPPGPAARATSPEPARPEIPAPVAPEAAPAASDASGTNVPSAAAPEPPPAPARHPRSPRRRPASAPPGKRAGHPGIVKDPGF